MTDAGPRLGQILREAREARELDLTRVERDTKIRLRYLTALEQGDYDDLPGAVYVRGFLRNYGHYLGLDPEYLIGLYRTEAGERQPDASVVLPRTAPPAPRAFVVTPGAIVTVVLTLFVAVFVVYLGYQFLTFAGTPTLEITDPARDVSSYDGTEYTIRGRTEPNSRIEVEGLRENPEAQADAEGDFTVSVGLVPGVNVITITASDPRTGRDTAPVQRTINVETATRPTSSPGVPTVVVAEPADGATVTGSVAVAGETSASEVRVTASLVDRAASSFRVTDAAGRSIGPQSPDPETPEPVELAVEGGRFTGELALAPGTWENAVAPVIDAGEPPTERRTVTVALRAQLTARLEVRGGPSWFELYEDGALDEDASLRNAPDGANIELTARRTIRIRAGSAGAVSVFVNGIGFGTMGRVGEVVEWTITAG